MPGAIVFFIMKQIKKLLAAVEHTSSREKQPTTSRVFPYTYFVLHRFLRTQSTVEASLFDK